MICFRKDCLNPCANIDERALQIISQVLLALYLVSFPVSIFNYLFVVSGKMQWLRRIKHYVWVNRNITRFKCYPGIGIMRKKYFVNKYRTIQQTCGLFLAQTIAKQYLKFRNSQLGSGMVFFVCMQALCRWCCRMHPDEKTDAF